MQFNNDPRIANLTTRVTLPDYAAEVGEPETGDVTLTVDCHGIHVRADDGSLVWLEISGGKLTARAYHPAAEEPVHVRLHDDRVEVEVEG